MKGKVFSSLKSCREAAAVACLKVDRLNMLIFFVLMLTPFMEANAVDLFKNGKQTVEDTFGSGSTVVWIIYVVEILAILYAYGKSKNLSLFASIAAVVVFVNVAFGIIPDPK